MNTIPIYGLIRNEVLCIDSRFLSETAPILEDKIKGSALAYLYILSGERDVNVLTRNLKISVDDLGSIINLFLDLGILNKTADVVYLLRRIPGANDNDFVVTVESIQADEKKKHCDKIDDLLQTPIVKWNCNSFIDFFKSLYYLENNIKIKEMMGSGEKALINKMIASYGTEKLRQMFEYAVKNWADIAVKQKKEYITIIGIFSHCNIISAEVGIKSVNKEKKPGEWGL